MVRKRIGIIVAVCAAAAILSSVGIAYAVWAIRDAQRKNTIPIGSYYTITYDLGELKADPYARIEKTAQPVKPNGAYTLQKPTCAGYTFKHWVKAGTTEVFTDGTYTLTADVTLTAVWEKDEYHDRWWTEFY